VICTWAREAAGSSSLERHLPDWLLIDWKQLRPGVHNYFLRNKTVLVPAIAKRQAKDVVKRVGLGHLDEHLEHYMNRFDWEMLHYRGPDEEQIHRLWTDRSISIVRARLWSSYTLTLCCFLSIVCVAA
jgi:hypothetical protein